MGGRGFFVIAKERDGISRQELIPPKSMAGQVASASATGMGWARAMTWRPAKPKASPAQIEPVDLGDALSSRSSARNRTRLLYARTALSPRLPDYVCTDVAMWP